MNPKMLVCGDASDKSIRIDEGIPLHSRIGGQTWSPDHSRSRHCKAIHPPRPGTFVEAQSGDGSHGSARCVSRTLVFSRSA